MRRQAVLVVLLALLGARSLHAQERIPNVEQALALGTALRGRSGPTGLSWIDGGARFSYLARNPRTGNIEVHAYDPGSSTDELLFDAGDLTVPGTTEPLQFRSLEWSTDSRHVVFEADFRPLYRNSGVADFYVYDVENGSFVLAADDARTGELSPDGTWLGYERDGDLYAFDMATEEERRLTSTGTENVWNGVFDWVYEEEFELAQAWSWSPDSRRIAYWQTHVAETPTIRITDWEGQYPEWTVMPFPKVGQPNSVVEIGVVDVATAQTRWMELDLDGEYYVPRIYWTNDPETLAIVTLNRPQNHLRLYFFDVTTGQGRLVMEETSDAWIDIFDFDGPSHYLYFPQGIDEFFWISDRDGYDHLYRYSYDGELLNQVTSGDWVVTYVDGIDVDSRTIYYRGTEESPLERHLYAVGFDGSDKRRLTREHGTHSIDMSPSSAYYVDDWSSSTRPHRVELWSTADGGRLLRTLEANSEVEALITRIAYSPVELFSFTTSDGVRLDASMIRPPDFDRNRPHPVLFSIYGGPGDQTVYDRWATNGWHQYLAQQGYVVVDVNSRGTGYYGRDFKEIVYGKLGLWAPHDFAELARWLSDQPWVDGDHMAIMGTSYGGFATVSTLVRYPGVFALGIANSAPTDWRLYDTIWTERYMGLLDENRNGYEEASLMSHVESLEDRLLLVHSGMDENVQPQHTMQLLTALARAGKDADLRFYPPGAHGAAFDHASQVTMYEVYTNELCVYAVARCTPANLNRDASGGPVF